MRLLLLALRLAQLSENDKFQAVRIFAALVQARVWITYRHFCWNLSRAGRRENSVNLHLMNSWTRVTVWLTFQSDRTWVRLWDRTLEHMLVCPSANMLGEKMGVRLQAGADEVNGGQGSHSAYRLEQASKKKHQRRRLK